MASTQNRKNLLYSAIATGIAEIATLPVCTVKTFYQNTKNKHIMDACKMMYNQYGVFAFYRASPAAVSSQILTTSLKYSCYQFLEGKKYKYSNKMLNGILGGILVSLITHPIDAIKIHMQMNVPLLPEIRKHGPRLFYRGYSKSFSKTVVGGALFFPLYEYTHNIIDNAIYASLTSAIMSTTIIHPIDYLKTRHIYGLPLYSGLNPLHYYKGISLNLLRTVPHFMIVMTVIDFLKRKL